MYLYYSNSPIKLVLAKGNMDLNSLNITKAKGQDSFLIPTHHLCQTCSYLLVILSSQFLHCGVNASTPPTMGTAGLGLGRRTGFSSMIFLIYFKKLCKYYNVPTHSTTIKSNNSLNNILLGFYFLGKSLILQLTLSSQ
jgi:hypothetical protein